jgi:nucleoside-diphosphate-sugar epimerase
MKETMKVLFVGGTGIISSACSRLALESGIELHLLCRGQSVRAVPPGAKVHLADIEDARAVQESLGSLEFDAVVNWIVFHPTQIERDLELFRGRTGQYVFISSASAYAKPVVRVPITESTPLCNPFWQYSRDKIACEDRLLRAFREESFPITIVRPSHTYDETLLPFDPYGGGYTVLDRMLRGKPVVVHGDGTSLWVLTHHKDFARGFVPLLGHPAAVGEAFHITSDEALPWNEVFRAVAHAAGVRRPQLVHVPSEIIAREHPEWGAGLLGDKAHSVVFDNSKVKRLVPDFRATIPFHEGAREIVSYHLRHPERCSVNASVNDLMDRLVDRFAG